MERSQARLNRKRRAVPQTQAYDKPSTKLKPATIMKMNTATMTSGLAYILVAFLAAASCMGCSLVPTPEIVQNRELEEILNLLSEQRVLPNVRYSTTNRSCAPGGPVSTWTVDGTAWTIVPPVALPTRVSEHLSGSPCQWTYTCGPAPANNRSHTYGPNPSVDRTPGIIVIRTGIFKPVTIRFVSGAIIARTGERQEKYIVFVVTLPGRTGSRCMCTAWAYHTQCEEMFGYSLCIPGTERTVKRFGGQGADQVSESATPKTILELLNKNDFHLFNTYVL